MKKILSLLLVIAMLAVSLVGCGGSGVEGKWESVYIQSGEMKVKAEGMTFELKKGGKLTATLPGTVGEGTWKEESGVISFTIEGDTVKGKVENNLLIVELGAIGDVYLSKDAKNFKYPSDVIDIPEGK